MQSKQMMHLCRLPACLPPNLPQLVHADLGKKLLYSGSDKWVASGFYRNTLSIT